MDHKHRFNIYSLDSVVIVRRDVIYTDQQRRMYTCTVVGLHVTKHIEQNHTSKSDIVSSDISCGSL